MDQTTSEGHNYAPLTAGFTANGTGIPQGRKNDYSAKRQSQLLDIYFNYQKNFSEHKIDLTAGYGWQYFYEEGYSFNRNFDESIINSAARTTKSENFLISFYGRLNYTFR